MNYSKNLYHSISSKELYSVKWFQNYPNQKNSWCNECKFSCWGIFPWKSFQLSTLFERAETYSGWKSNYFTRFHYVTTMEAMQFNKEFPSLLFGRFSKSLFSSFGHHFTTGCSWTVALSKTYIKKIEIRNFCPFALGVSDGSDSLGRKTIKYSNW